MPLNNQGSGESLLPGIERVARVGCSASSVLSSGTTVTFVSATAATAVIDLDASATRRLVATPVNDLLHRQFAGDITIERIGGLSLRGVDGVRVRVKDPTGMQVLFVDGARVRIRAIAGLRAGGSARGEVLVSLDDVSIDHAEGAIDGDRVQLISRMRLPRELRRLRMPVAPAASASMPRRSP